MASDGQILFEVVVDGKRATADIKDITRMIQQESGKWEDAAKESTEDIGNSFSGMLKTIAGGFSAMKIGKALLDIGKDAVEAASDLQEVQNVVDTTFGDNASVIEKWAKNAGTQFGLTETMAKKFASTMGAMLKSSGMAGDEIVNVSTDLAGLAADMASFYNLDFEEAFSKIRSGISGQTMPLKELGIDMSVATLNAFALEKGLTKTFDQMSQSEQIMLRYQYLMKATSDAQGDFADTSDGFANGVRKLSTELDTLKTNLGSVMIDHVNNFLGLLNGFFVGDRKTIVDEINEVTEETEAKVTDIKAVTEEAKLLVAELDKIAGADPGAVMTGISNGANLLDAKSPSLWRSLLNSLRNIDGLQNIFGEGDEAVKNIEALSNALSGGSIDQSIADAWSTLLTALGSNEEVLTQLTGQSADDSREWLHQMATAANELEPGSAEGWSELLTALVAGLPGLQDTEAGKKFLDSLATNYLALGNDSEVARAALADLGFGTDEITKKQDAWLQTCKRLVQIIPGLSEIINTETGEIKGGVQAVKDYIDAWSEENILRARVAGLRAKKAQLEQAANIESDTKLRETRVGAVAALMTREGMTEAEADAYLKKYTREKTVQQSMADMSKSSDDVAFRIVARMASNAKKSDVDSLKKVSDKTLEAMDAYTEAYEEARILQKELPVAQELYQQEMEDLAATNHMTVEELEALVDGTEDAEEAAKAWGEAEEKAAQEAVEAARDATKAVADYYESVWNSVSNSVSNAINGFNRVKLAGDDLRKQQTDLANEEIEVLNNEKYSEVWNNFGKDGKSALDAMDEYVAKGNKLTDVELEAYNALAKVRNEQKQVNDALNEYNPESMVRNMQGQIQYMKEYLANLKTLREWGVSDELIAFLSDGSEESAEYLHQLVGDNTEASKQAALEVDKVYSEVAEEKKKFTDALTENQLTVDQTYSDLVERAREAVEALDMQGEAAESAGKTIQGVAQGIRDNVPAVASAVDEIIAQFDRLAGYGFDFGFDEGGSFWLDLIPQHETGLNYVPFDGYLASLHEGEGILTAEENRIWQRFKDGGNTFDYDAMGNVMRDNVKPGGNVYLDGRMVGSVISDQQGKSFRHLQRSGWQG